MSIDYDGIVATFRDEFSSDLHSRQAHLLLRVARQNADGFHASDFTKLHEILKVGFNALEETGDVFVAPMCQLVKIFGKPYQRKTANEERYDAAAIPLAGILHTMSGALTCGYATVEKDVAQALLAFVLAHGFDDKTQDNTDSAWKFHQQLLFRSGCLDLLAAAYKHHAQLFADSNGDETSSETLAWVSQILRECSEDSVNCFPLLALDVLSYCMFIMETAANSHDPVVPLAVDILWNLLEQSIAQMQDNKQHASSLDDLSARHRKLNALLALSELRTFRILYRLLQQLISRGYTQADKELRNDITVLCLILLKQRENIPYFIASGCFDLLLTLCIAAENELPLTIPVAQFASASDIDHEFKLLVWAMIRQICTTPEFTTWYSRDTGMQVSSSANLDDFLVAEFESGTICSGAFAAQDVPLLQTLLKYLDVNMLDDPYMSLWTPPQRRSLELAALRLLTAILPLMPEKFTQLSGPRCLMRYICAHAALDRSALPPNLAANTEYEADYGRVLVASRLLVMASASMSIVCADALHLGRFVDTIPSVPPSGDAYNQRVAVTMLSTTHNTDAFTRILIDEEDVRHIHDMANRNNAAATLVDDVAAIYDDKCTGSIMAGAPTAADTLQAVVQDEFIVALTGILASLPDSDLPPAAGTSTRRILSNTAVSMQNVTSAQLTAEGRTFTRPSDVKEALLTLMAVIAWKLVQYRVEVSGEHLLHNNDNTNNSSSDDAPTGTESARVLPRAHSEADVSLALQLQSLQDTFESVGGVAMLVRIIKHSLVDCRAGSSSPGGALGASSHPPPRGSAPGAAGSNLAEASGSSQRARVTTAALSALLAMVWEHPGNELAFASLGGVETVFDLMECAPRQLTPMCLSVVGTVCASVAARNNLLAWRSDATAKTLAHLLVDLWIAEEKRLGVLRVTSAKLIPNSSNDDFTNPAIDVLRQQAGETLTDTLSAADSVAFRSLRRALEAARSADNTALSSMNVFPGNYVGACVNAVDLRHRIYGVIQCISMETFASLLHEKVDYTTLINAELIRMYPKLVEGLAWHDVRSHLNSLEVALTAEDAHLCEEKVAQTSHAVAELVERQRAYVDEYQATEFKKQTSLSQSMLFPRTSTLSTQELQQFSATGVITPRHLDAKHMTMDDRKHFLQVKQAMLSRSLIGYKKHGESVVYTEHKSTEGGEEEHQHNDHVVSEEIPDVFEDSLDDTAAPT